MSVFDWAARTYVSQMVRNTKRSCAYWGRYRPILITALTPLVTGPELAAIVAGYAALDIVCDIVSRIPDPPPS